MIDLGSPVATAGVGQGSENRTHAPDEQAPPTDYVQAARHIARISEGFAAL